MSPDDPGMTAVFGTIGKATIALVLFIGNLVVVNLIRGLPRRNLYAEAIALALLQADRLFSVYDTRQKEPVQTVTRQLEIRLDGCFMI